MISGNILKLRERIKRSCGPVNQQISLVVVIKGRTVEQIKEAIDAGITDIGENRVQEAVLKFEAIRPTPYAQRIKWHMVGHLQGNKVKDAVGIFDLIQSVDSLRLAELINKEASKINKVQDILLEVKTSPEASKSGFGVAETVDAAKKISQFKNLRIKGLMTIAPLLDDPQKSRPYFKELRELKEEINSVLCTLSSVQILSMGMSDDFEAAIAEGSNMVRIGRAIFEDRD